MRTARIPTKRAMVRLSQSSLPSFSSKSPPTSSTSNSAKTKRRSRTSTVPCLSSETWASSPPLVSAYNPRMPPTCAARDSQNENALLSSESASEQPRSPRPNKRPLQPAPRCHGGTLHVYVLVSAPLHHDTGYILARPLPRKARAALPPATHLSLRKNQ